MGKIWRFIRWVGIVMSPVGIVANLVLNGIGVWQLGEKGVWIWTAIGATIFFICMISLVYSQHTKLTKLEHAETGEITKAIVGKESPADAESLSGEQRDLLLFYQRQKENWQSNLRLRIIRVLPGIDIDVPEVRFEMEMANYFPVEIRLVKVVHSSGNVSASGLGSCMLPSLPETIDERVNACSEKQFFLEMEIGKTKAPDFLRPKLREPGQLLQWTLKGEWYVEIDSKTEIWASQSQELRYDQVIKK